MSFLYERDVDAGSREADIELRIVVLSASSHPGLFSVPEIQHHQSPFSHTDNDHILFQAVFWRSRSHNINVSHPQLGR